MREIITKLQSLDELFHAMDSAPLASRRLSDAASAYLLASVEEAPGKAPLRVTLVLPEKSCSAEIEGAMRVAVPAHFARLADVCNREIKRIAFIGRLFLPLGFIVMFLSVVASELLDTGQRRILHSLSESMLVFGWVVLWAPLDFLLFRRLPLFRQRALYLQLANAEVKVQHTP
jgi:hypothetical protein